MAGLLPRRVSPAKTPMLTQPVKFYAPEDFPEKQAEIRAYTVAAFRVAQSGLAASAEPLAPVDMQRNLVDFLIKGRAIDYWKKQRWLQGDGMTYRLTEEGLAICAKSPLTASGTPGPADVAYWDSQFRSNSSLPRKKTLRVALPPEAAAN
jgi:hypothetical protein